MPTLARQVELTPCRRHLIEDSRRHGVLGAHVELSRCAAAVVKRFEGDVL